MDPASPAEELKFLCRKLLRQSTNFDVLAIVNALQARLIDEMRAGWGRPKPQRGEDLNRLLELARKLQSPQNGSGTRIAATELVARLEVELSATTAPADVADVARIGSRRPKETSTYVDKRAVDIVDKVSTPKPSVDTSSVDADVDKSNRRAYQRQWARRRRAAAKA